MLFICPCMPKSKQIPFNRCGQASNAVAGFSSFPLLSAPQPSHCVIPTNSNPGWAMARKKYRDKTCVYCGRDRASSTGDHVVAREFCLRVARENLPKVPACVSCNNANQSLSTMYSRCYRWGACSLAQPRSSSNRSAPDWPRTRRCGVNSRLASRSAKSGRRTGTGTKA